MKRITVLGIKFHTDEIITQLQDCGVLHVTAVNPPESSSLEKIADAIFLSEFALQKIPANAMKQCESKNISKIVNDIVMESDLLDSYTEELSVLNENQMKYASLGHFDPQDIIELHNKGIHISLYEIEKSKVKKYIPDSAEYIVIGKSLSNKLMIAVVSYNNTIPIDLVQFPLPSISLRQLSDTIKSKNAACERIQENMKGYSQYIDHINRNILHLRSLLKFEIVRAGAGNTEDLVFLKGYCPYDKTDILSGSAQKNGWGLLIEDPLPQENPPTLIRNPAWIRIIRPVFTLLNIIPGYHELDVSFFFLFFLSIFFGMIIGDAGYGFLILFSFVIIHILTRKKLILKESFYLMYVLSIATIIWGALTGNWFGIEAFVQIPPFNLLIIPSLNTYTVSAQKLIMSICFYIAAIHLSLAHILVIFKNLRLWNALANTGWVMMVWVMFFIAQNQVLGIALPYFFTFLLFGAFGFIVVFSLFDRAPDQSLAELIIANIVLSTINTFADTVSYIRLFAVSLATLAVAQSFNRLALQIGFGNLIAASGSIMVILFGHSLNIALAAMAVIVHGIRLNMLEFSSHVGNTWSGYRYEPFQKSNKP